MKGDKNIICICGEPFIFTVGEQRFYKERSYEEPKRCPDCRLKRRQQREEQQRREEEIPLPEDRG